MSWVLKKVLPINQLESYTIYGNDLYVANEDNSIRQWNLSKGQVVAVFQNGHHGKITSIVYTDRWKALFSVAVDGSFCIWFSGKLIGTYLNRELRTDPFGIPMYSCVFYPKTDQVFVGSRGEILVFQIYWEFIQKSHDHESAQQIIPVARINLHKDNIHLLLVADDIIVSASHDRTVGFLHPDAFNCKKTVPLVQKQPITSLKYDKLSQTVYVTTMGGRIHSLTRDGLILHNENIGNGISIFDMAIDHILNLVWIVMGNGKLYLRDYSNFSTDLTDYFDTLFEKPIVGVSDYKFFSVFFDEVTKNMVAFVNDHYCYIFKYDESAPRISMKVNPPMYNLSTFHYQNDDYSHIGDPTNKGYMKNGNYVIGGSNSLQIYYQESDYAFNRIMTIPADGTITCTTFFGDKISFGDDKGNIKTIQTSTLKKTESSERLPGSVTTIHLTNISIICTTNQGSWYIFSLDNFPSDHELVSIRDFAHTGSINSSYLNRERSILLTAGSDGFLKFWNVNEDPQSSSRQQQTVKYGPPTKLKVPSKSKRSTVHIHNDNSESRRVLPELPPQQTIFMTESGTGLSETQVIDMREYGEVTNVGWALRSRKIITTHSDRQIRIWSDEIGNSTLQYVIPCGGCGITAFAVDASNYILAALDDKTIRVFSTRKGELARTLIGHKSSINAISVQAGFCFYVSTSWDGGLKFWKRSIPPPPSRVNTFIQEQISKSILSKIASANIKFSATNPGSSSLFPQSPNRSKTALKSPVPVSHPLPQIHTVSIYEQRKAAQERRERKEKAEFEAKMRTPFAKELKAMSKLMIEIMDAHPAPCPTKIDDSLSQNLGDPSSPENSPDPSSNGTDSKNEIETLQNPEPSPRKNTKSTLKRRSPNIIC